MSPTTSHPAVSSWQEGASEEKIVVTGTVETWLRVQEALDYEDIEQFIWDTIDNQTVDFPADAVVDVVFTHISRQFLLNVLRGIEMTVEESGEPGVDATIKLS